MNSPAASSNRSGRIRTTRRSSQPRFIVILPFAPLSQTSQTALPNIPGPCVAPVTCEIRGHYDVVEDECVVSVIVLVNVLSFSLSPVECFTHVPATQLAIAGIATPSSKMEIISTPLIQSIESVTIARRSTIASCLHVRRLHMLLPTIGLGWLGFPISAARMHLSIYRR